MAYPLLWYYQVPALFVSVVVAITVWSLIWKGFALYKSASRGQAVWFVILLLFNTAGILPIIYLLIYWNKEDRVSKEERKVRKEAKRKARAEKKAAKKAAKEAKRSAKADAKAAKNAQKTSAKETVVAKEPSIPTKSTLAKQATVTTKKPATKAKTTKRKTVTHK